MHRHIKDTINLSQENCCSYSDSMVVLNWLDNAERRNKRLVICRVAEIQRLVGKDFWRHVTWADNFADLSSRRINPKQACAEWS